MYVLSTTSHLSIYVSTYVHCSVCISGLIAIARAQCYITDNMDKLMIVGQLVQTPPIEFILVHNLV